jgi:hypothetical protein
VVTGEQPYPGANDGTIMYNVVIGERPARPQEPNGLVSDDVWNSISRCWSPSRDSRPDVNFVMSALNDAADAIEARRGKACATATDQGTSTSYQGAGMSRIFNTDHEQTLTIAINRYSPAES